MTDLEKTAQLFSVKADELNYFENIEDFFNPGTTLTGYLCRRQDHRYGALHLTKINSRPTSQVIYGTPKIHYPFDKLGRWSWPKVQRLNVYTKLDGTNIVTVRYLDPVSDSYKVTYKTRLTPIVQSGRFGAFREMLLELLQKYPGIPEVALSLPGLSLSFEMFGARNTHLIEYDTPLDLKLLFGISQTDASVIDPLDLPEVVTAAQTRGRLPSFPDRLSLAAGHDVNTFYKKLTAEQEAMNVKTEVNTIRGSEGYVFYVKDTENKVTQFKAKPESVLEIHFANGGLSKLIIRAACFKALENSGDELLVTDKVKELLREDFDTRQVEAYHYQIESVILDVYCEIKLRDQVLSRYEVAQKETGATIQTDKRAIMRWMAQHFAKDKMGWVYYLLTH